MNTENKLLLLLLLSIGLFACNDKITEKRTYMANVPIYMSVDEFKSSVKKTGQQEVNNPGKIYIKDEYLYVNEINKGVHVFDNSTPSNPQYICFINIPGNVDMAIKGNILYADSYIDLIALDISDPNQPELIDRQENAFPDIYPLVDANYPCAPIDESKGIVVDWKVQEITTTESEYQNNYKYLYSDVALMDMAETNSGGNMSGNIGIAGSMARFAIKGNALYAINNGYELKIFDIGTHKIKKVDSISVSWNIETLFVYKDNLFIGSNNGMYIYGILDTKNPIYISQYNHITSCDPVVVNNEYAFITLRSGNNCMNTINELNVVSIKNIYEPKLVKAYPMYNPHGLGLDGNTLFICDGDAGLKVYDASDVYNINNNLIKTFENIRTFDVIPYNNVLIMTGDDGIFQYDYSDINNIKEISHISTTSLNN